MNKNIIYTSLVLASISMSSSAMSENISDKESENTSSISTEAAANPASQTGKPLANLAAGEVSANAEVKAADGTVLGTIAGVAVDAQQKVSFIVVKPTDAADTGLRAIPADKGALVDNSISTTLTADAFKALQVVKVEQPPAAQAPATADTATQANAETAS